jgi:hypothetical protein
MDNTLMFMISVDENWNLRSHVTNTRSGRDDSQEINKEEGERETKWFIPK